MFSKPKMTLLAIFFILLDLIAPKVLLGFQPLIPLSKGVSELPFTEVALREPKLVKNGISDDIYFEQSFERVRELEAELKLYKGNSKANAYKKLFETYLQMAYFLEDIKAKRIPQAANYGQIDKKIRNLRSKAIFYATSYSKIAKNRQLKSNAAYHILVTNYLNGYNRAQQIRNLSNIRKSLSPYLQRRADFIIAYHNLFSRRKEASRRQLKSLIKSLPKEAAIAARLALAQSYAGLSKSGRKVAKPNGSYAPYLRVAGLRSRGLSEADKDLVLSYSIDIWRKASGSNHNWSTFPIDLSNFKNLPTVNAIKERVALGYLKRKQYSKAIEIYKSISGDFEGKPLEVGLDKRLMSIYRLADRPRKSGNYERVLISYKEKYQGKAPSRDQQLMLSEIKNRYKTLVKKRFSYAFKTKQPSSINLAIGTINRFIDTYQLTGRDYLVNKEIVAKLHITGNQRKFAVKVYSELSDRAESNQDKSKYLRLAIQSQSILARWPSTPPWQGFRKGMRPQRLLLVSLYEASLNLSNRWGDAAHLGLLYTAVGSHDRAFQLWLSHLKKNPRTQQAEYAAGYMAHVHHQRKQWVPLESLLRITMKDRISLRYRRKTLNSARLLSDALFYGGKELFAANNYTSARDKLKEFSERFKHDPRMDEALIFLARSYHHSKDHVASIDTVTTLINDYPRSRYKKSALLYGAQWSVPMAYEDHAISFYQTFLDEFPKDSRNIRVIDNLIPLYLGRGLFAQARDLYLVKSKDKRIDRQVRVDAAIEAMELEERYGDMNTAQVAAIRVRTIAGNDSLAMSRVLAFEIRKAASEDNIKKIRSLERKLTDIAADGERRDLEAIAEARLYIAKSNLRNIQGKIFNLKLKDPKTTLEQRFASFKILESDYKRVCQIGTTSFCPLAMMELSQATTSLAESIDDISIPETLTESEVEGFKRLKLSILDDLNEVSTSADDSALSHSESGETIPDFSRAVLWDNHEEWNYESSNPSPGNGYIQWSTGGLNINVNR